METIIRAAFPGSFDPPTYGHIDIIQRASKIFDELLVVVAENRQKKYIFPLEERCEMLMEMCKNYKNISVKSCDILIVDFLKKQNVNIMVRGVRSVPDFTYEFELSMMNKILSPQIETIFMTTRPEFIVLRSSSVRELASFNADITSLVPPLVAQALYNKYKKE